MTLTTLELIRMKFTFGSLFLLLFATGCGATYTDEMLTGDGQKWRLTIVGNKQCYVKSTEEKCVSIFKPYIQSRATRLCGTRAELSECKKAIGNGQVGATCIATCAETKNIQEPVQGSDTDKTKKCQAKGGNWINGTCQIAID